MGRRLAVGAGTVLVIACASVAWLVYGTLAPAGPDTAPLLQAAAPLDVSNGPQQVEPVHDAPVRVDSGTSSGVAALPEEDAPAAGLTSYSGEPIKAPTTDAPKRFLAYYHAFGRRANQLHGLIGAFAAAKVLDRTLILPAHLCRASSLTLSADTLALDGIKTITEAQLTAQLQSGTLPPFSSGDVVVAAGALHTGADEWRKGMSKLLGVPLESTNAHCARVVSGADAWQQLHGAKACRVAVVGTLLYAGMHTSWFTPRPYTSAFSIPPPMAAGSKLRRLDSEHQASHRPTAPYDWRNVSAGLQWCKIGAPPGTTGLPCLAQRVGHAEWVAPFVNAWMGRQKLVRLPTGQLPLIVVHLRTMKSKYNHGNPALPCCEPSGRNILARLRELGLWEQGRGMTDPRLRVFIMGDSLRATKATVGELVKALGRDVCVQFDEDDIVAAARSVNPRISAKEALHPDTYADVAPPSLVAEMFIAEAASVFIGNRFSTLSLWVSNARVVAGLASSTHAYCDDMPLSAILPGPSPLHPSPPLLGLRAISEEKVVRACEAGAVNKLARVEAAAQFGCRYSNTDAWSRIRTALPPKQTKQKAKKKEKKKTKKNRPYNPLAYARWDRLEVVPFDPATAAQVWPF